MIVDADDYFKAARAAMLKAKRQVILIGWDFDARIRLGESSGDDGPQEVGAFFSWLVQRTPDLHIYILRWDTGAIKTLFHGRTLLRLLFSKLNERDRNVADCRGLMANCATSAYGGAGARTRRLASYQRHQA